MAKPGLIRLQDGSCGRRYQVARIMLPDKLRRRLEALGLVEGTVLTILNRKRNGAAAVKFRGARFAFGSGISEHILVTEKNL